MAPTQKKTVQRVRLSLKDKFDLVQDSNKNMKVEELAKKYKCGKSAVYDILKKKKEVIDNYMSAQNTEVKTKAQAPKYDRVDKMTYNWLIQVLSKKLPVSGIMIQEKAKEFAEQLNEKEFKASNGWLEKFKIRHSLTFANLCGESESAPQRSIDDFLEKLPGIISGYDIKDIANVDETGLFYRAIPKKSICKKGEKCHGGKQSKERLTVMLCCFADGTFEKPLVIGKSKKPRCFNKIDIDKLPVIWKSNRKAWMTSDIMEEWLIRLNKKMSMQKRKILLFLDNATSHPNLNLSNVKLVFLPPNTTSHIQPLDQGIINSFKVHYRTNVVKRLLSRIDDVSNVFDLVKSVDVLDAIYWIKQAIEKMPNTVIPNCFRKAGFKFQQHSEIADDANVPLRELRVVLERIQCDDMASVEDFVCFDDDLLTESDTFTTNSTEKAVKDSDDDDSDSEVTEETADIELTESIALLSIDRLKKYACKEGLEPLYAKIAECANMIQDAVIAKHTKQSTIQDYYDKQ